MKMKIDLIVGIILTIISVIILLLPIFNVTNIVLILKFLFISYAIVNLGRFIFNRETKDLEGLYSFIATLVMFIILFFINVTNSSLKLALFIFLYVIIESLIRLKKADFYHDRKEKIWILEVTTLIIFGISGLLTSFGILLNFDSSILLIGFLFFINGFIEIIDPITNYIIKTK